MGVLSSQSGQDLVWRFAELGSRLDGFCANAPTRGRRRLMASSASWQHSHLYPGPLPTQNTFIHFPVSLEGFHERQAFSCPVTPVSEPGEAAMWAGPCCISSHAGLDRHLLQLGLPHLLPKSAHDTREKSTAAPQVLQGMEDRELVLDPSLDEVQGDLAKVLATQARLVNQKERSLKRAEDWYRTAEMAVEEGDDERAKEAWSLRQSALQEATGLQNQIDAMTGNVEDVEELFESVKALEARVGRGLQEERSTDM
ncbi:unnamed protein product [Durusdinium trenchii]|uniref:Biogenesis of lysosome-related organelles complex 1 subunit 1 n=1 Tax=Durusdinium trenchii TaxID=1381693 RepID=A0ABP0QB55_9DINO